MKLVTPSLAAVLLICGTVAQAEKPAPAPAPPAPPRQELWVPTESLERVLKDHPNAVMLTRQQYEALIRDAGKVKPEDDPAANQPPKEIFVESLRLRGKVEPGADHVSLTGELILHAPAEGWVQTRLPWPWTYPLTTVSAEGPVLANLSYDGDVRHLDLAVKGPGRRVLKFGSVVPLQRWLGESVLSLPSLPCVGLLELELPDDAVITGGSPHERTGRICKVPFLTEASSAGAIRLSWQVRAAAADASMPVRFAEQAAARYEVQEAEVRAFISFSPHAMRAGLTEVTWEIIGPGAQVVSLDGPAVKTWRQEGAKLIATLDRVPTSRTIEVQLRMPWDGAATELTLPILQLGTPLKARLQVTVSDGLELLSTTGAVELDKERFFSLGGAPLVVRVQSARPRLEADVDALVKLERDSVNIQRTLALRSDRPLREARLTIPVAEEFIAVTSPVPGFEWKRVDRTLELRFPQLLKPGAPAAVSLTSRKKLVKAWTGPRIAEALTLENIAIPEAVKLAGYTALEFDDAWRVSLKEVRGLEDRDARLTPVKGRMAWFGLRDWSLGMEVERAESIYSAEVTAYALPRARTVEIEGQFTLDISGAPLRTFQVKLPAAVAGLLRVTSPLVGEQQLDETTGLWTFTLRQESKGRPNIRFRMSLPAAGDQTTKATLPHLEMPQVRRFHGSWIIEANTDTQLTFESRSMQPLDVLRAPAVEGYQPRHRLVSAFTYGAGAHELTITAQRHGRSELAVLIVKSLRMTTVLSTDGASRHEAVINLRHSGEQFIPVRLPPAARLLSVLVEHGAYKPVRGEDGTLAVPLPAESANRANVRLSIIYDLPGEAWGGAGQRQLIPVTFPGNIPILATDWRVHVPEGYSYDKVRTNLIQEEGAIVESRRKFPSEAEALRTSQKTINLLKSVLLSKVQMAGVSVPDAVNFLRQKLATQTEIPEARSIRIVYLPGDLPRTDQISLDLADVPFDTALRYVTELAGMSYRITSDRVTIVPVSESYGSMVTRIFKVPSDIQDRISAPAQTVPNADPFAASSPPRNDVTVAAGTHAWWVEAFKAQGITFPEGADAIFDEERSELIVINSQPNLDIAEMFINSLLTREERAAYAALEPAPVVYEEPTVYLTNKMRQIVFPSVQFADASIAEAIEFLRTKSRDLDEAEPDPARKGVTILLTGSESSTSKISLDLKDVPMDVALRYVTELAGMKYKVEPFAVIVVPVTETTTERYTRSFRVPPDFLTSGAALAAAPAPAANADPFATTPGGGTAALQSRPTSIDILKSQGITFAEGDSAMFNPLTSQLIVTGTQPNLDIVEMLVDSINKNAPPPPVIKAGLLPLNLELPTSGVLLRFHGAQAPEPLRLSFASWERQLAMATLWMLLGAAAFAWWGRKRFAWRTLLILLLMLAAVPLVAPALQTTANGFLIGWLIALGAWWLWCIASRMPALKSEAGEEVAA